MKKYMTSVFMFASLTVSCFAQRSGSEIGISSACGENQIKYNAKKNKITTAVVPNGELATIYVFSKLNYGGIPIGCQAVSRVGIDGKWIGANCGTSYIATTISPGKHHLCVDWQSPPLGSHLHPALDSVDVARGGAYYFRATLVYSEGIVDLSLSPLNADEGQLLIGSVPASLSKPKE